MAERLIFISYARKDGLAFANELHDRLIQFELFPWLDLRRLKAGDAWARKIDMAIEDCIVFILVVTPGSLKSPYVAREYRYAMGREKLIIPLIIDSNVQIAQDIPEDVRRYQCQMFVYPTHDDWERLGRQLQIEHQRFDVPDEIRDAHRRAKSPTQSDRKDALNYLCNTDHPSGRSALEELCRHHNSDVKKEAALALAGITTPPSHVCIEGLKLALDDNRHDGDARSFLIQINDAVAANALFDVYKTAANHRQHQIIQAMIHFSDPYVIPYLREMYKSHKSTNALKKLAEFGDVESIPEIELRVCAERVEYAERAYYLDKLSQDFESPYAEQALMQILKDFWQHYKQHPEPYHQKLIQLVLSKLEDVGNENAAKLLQEFITPLESRYQMMYLFGTASLAAIRRKLGQ